jgi:hypothetical protein
MSRSYTSSPPQAPPWRVEGQLYFFYHLKKHSNKRRLATLVFRQLLRTVQRGRRQTRSSIELSRVVAGIEEQSHCNPSVS